MTDTYMALEQHADRMVGLMPDSEVAAIREYNLWLVKMHGPDSMQYMRAVGIFMDYLIIRINSITQARKNGTE